MSRFIESVRYPGRPIQEPELRALFGVKGGKWPKSGCSARVIQGIWVHVLPSDHISLVAFGLLGGRKKKRSQHRCLAACPGCGKTVSAGRLAQHRCKPVATA